MKITDERKDNKIEKSKDIKIGDCFEYQNEIYLKICGSGSFNAISLKDSTATIFYGQETVKPIDAELIIRGVRVDDRT